LEITAQNVLSSDGQSLWPIALIYLDLNAFKPINDNYSHEAGDLVLNHVARCLQTSVRSKDVVVRLGGDEFVVLLFRANRSAADIVIDRIRSHLQKPVEFQSNLLQVEVMESCIRLIQVLARRIVPAYDLAPRISFEPGQNRVVFFKKDESHDLVEVQ
jgi:diguanylate cyclase (GGDEF)-like protein